MRFTCLLLRVVESFKDISILKTDVIKLKVHAGSGGYGIPRYNGIGGNGGSVFLRVDDKLTFKQFTDHFENNSKEIHAENGENSRQVKLAGRHGSDEFLNVPYGVECVDESSMLLARCINLKKPYLIVRGGHGGHAANNYKRELGECMSVYIHFKLRPNVGLLGFPNAGKSTLLKALVPEKPVKIANYPFTTLKPQMCYLKMNEHAKENISEENSIAKYALKDQPFTLSIADLPGIIEGASRNRGVGHAFLKHLEYSEIIAMVVDVHGFQLNASLNEPFRTAIETVALLNHEAEVYSKKLLQKRFVLVLNKIDIKDGERKAAEIAKIFGGNTPNERRSWIGHVAKELRPKRPIAFEHVSAISAKNANLGNLMNVLKSIHKSLHPRKQIVFEEEMLDKGITLA